MIQNGDKVITVLETRPASADAATALVVGEKTDRERWKILPGWPTKAYAGSLKDLSAVGLVKDTTFLEVRVTDPTPGNNDVAAKLQTAMKAVAARLPWSITAPGFMLATWRESTIRLRSPLFITPRRYRLT